MPHVIRVILWQCTFLCLAISEPIVYDSIHDVTYKGSLSTDGGVEYFQGVHYAQNTAGKNRFAPPVPLPNADPGALIDATKRGAACPQPMIDIPTMFDKPEEISEDCLTLHIARPANVNITSESRLPVLAWVPGGGAMFGSGSDAHINPEKLLSRSAHELHTPVIYVAINYRLGIFGFAASDTLQKQKSMNVGLRDQRLAFEWLQENIVAFGGDPDRITSYGMSAGGTFTALQHMAFAGAKGLPFSQAFMMSGPAGTGINMTSDYTKVNTAVVASRLNCPVGGQEMLDCMRGVSMEQMMNTSYAYAMEHHPPLGFFVFVAVIDGDIIPDRPSKLLRDGRFIKCVPTILAWAEDDTAAFLGPAESIQSEDDI